jgi:DNA helicase II / ATP-dependent DNA helicase PcrA
VPGSRIFAVTFTRLAASQLANALQALGAPGAEDVHTSTLHSYAFSLLNREQAISALGRNPRPCLNFELDPLYHDLAGEFGGVVRARALAGALDAMWARTQSDAPGAPRAASDIAFEEQFVSWMRFHQGMAIGELVPLAVKFLTSNPVNSAQAAFDHVIVDEYQDLNRADQRLIELVGGSSVLAVIGDDDQSIYGFRYAHPEGIRDWITSQPYPADDVSMTLSRRSDGRLLKVSNALIRQNPGRVRGDLLAEPAREEKGDLTLVQWPTREAETQGIADAIQRLFANGGVPMGESLIAIVPRHQFGVALLDRLTGLGVQPVKLHSAPDWGNPDLQKSATLFTLANRPDDRIALRAWLGFGKADWRRNQYARLRALSESSGRSPTEILSVEETCKTAKLAILRQRWVELQSELSVLRGLPTEAMVDRLFPPGGPFDAIGARLKTVRSESDELAGTRLLAGAMVGPEADSTIPGVNIMTYYAAKGLTCHTVVVTALVNGLLPRNPIPADPSGQRILEEERRLLYVALTRAKHRIVLSSFRSASRGENAQLRLGLSGRGYRLSTQASMFLSELGPGVPPTMTGGDWLRALA